MTKETVLVAGSGIAGLAAALALGGGAREVTIVDRDPAPPELSPEDAFYKWERRGATQLRHSHAFIGRLTTLIRERYPDLLAELLGEGARLFGYTDALLPTLESKYRRASGDEDMTLLFSRRTTLELVMRRYVSKLPGIRFVPDAGVRGLITRRENGKLVAEGLQVERNGALEEMRADVVVDATGRNTAFPDWLRQHGLDIREEESPCGILYFTRHYKLRDGQDEPPRDGTPGAGDLGYIKFGVFVADNRHFSITLAVPEIESEMRMAVVKPETFDTLCMAIPGAARWVDPARSEPVSQVFSMGNLQNVWRHFLKGGEPQVLGFFPLGDAAVRTNPLYGRGCSVGFALAHVLRATLDESADPAERARIFDKGQTEIIRPYFDSMVKLDKQAINRAKIERKPVKLSLRGRILKSLAEDGFEPAQRGDIEVNRAMTRIFHMLDEPTAFLKRKAIWARVLIMWITPRIIKKARGYYPPSFGPNRQEMFQHLGLTG